MLIGVLSKRMASLKKSPIEERALGAVVMLGVKHFILSVWGLRKLRKLWNYEWRLFFSLLMKAKPLVLLEPRAFLSVPFPSSLLPHRETFFFIKESLLFAPKQLLPLLRGHRPTPFLALPIMWVHSLTSPCCSLRITLKGWYCSKGEREF